MANLNVVLRSKVVEPCKRLKGNLTSDWIIHRFPIKGGISLRDAWLIDMSRPNPLLKPLLERNYDGIITKSE
jgi:hypothetical protein